jgi:hypothetical protein
MSQVAAQSLVGPDNPLVGLTAKWAALRLPVIDPAMPPVTTDHPVLLVDAQAHVNDSLLGLFLTLANSMQDANQPIFDMTPRAGHSPIDSVFLARVGIAEPDRPAALTALHGCLRGWAAQGLPLLEGAKITQGPAGEVLLHATTEPNLRAPRTRKRGGVYRPGQGAV